MSAIKTYKSIKPKANHVIIYTEVELENVRKGKGYDGRDLLLQTEKYFWMDNTRIYADVVAVPERVAGNITVAHDHPGFPVGDGYYSGGILKARKTIDNIIPEVEVGDRLYFDFDILGNMEYSTGTRLGDGYFAVRYDQIICTVRNGEIIMIGGWVLIDPQVEENLLPVRDAQGNLLPKERWIAKTPDPSTAVALHGTLRHIGKPLRCDDPLDIEPGDRIIFSYYSEYKMVIEGKEYFCMKQRDILAVYEKE